VDIVAWILELHPECKIVVSGSLVVAVMVWRHSVATQQRAWRMADRILTVGVNGFGGTSGHAER